MTLDLLKKNIKLIWNKNNKLVQDILDVDITISMGCNIDCPYIGKEFDDNWNLDDSTGKNDDEFIKVIKEIEKRIKSLNY